VRKLDMAVIGPRTGPIAILARVETRSSGGWAILGVPVDCSGTSRGEERGPAALRDAGLAAAVEAVDMGDVDARIRDARRDPATGVIGFESVLLASERIRDGVAAVLGTGRRPLVVGGCCTLLPGVMAGVAQRGLAAGLAFVDGHLDFYDGETSDTGEAADMPLAILLGHGPERLVRLGGETPAVEPSSVVAIGYRDDAARRRLRAVEPDEFAPEIGLVHGRELRRGDVAAIGRRTAERLEGRSDGFWLHFDLDVLDQDVLPAVTYPQPGGPGWTDTARLLEPLVRSRDLIGIDVTDFNADKDPDGTQARLVVGLLGAIMHSQRSQ
jgi:arginase